MTFNLPHLKSVFYPLRRGNTHIDNIFNEFLDNVDRQFKHSLLSHNEQNFYPLIDILDTTTHYNMEIDLPGIKKEDVTINIDNNILSIIGHRKTDSEYQGNHYYSRERSYGEFRRSVSLPSNINKDQIDADFKNGVLTIRIPKEKPTTAKTIDIK